MKRCTFLLLLFGFLCLPSLAKAENIATPINTQKTETQLWEESDGIDEVTFEDEGENKGAVAVTASEEGVIDGTAIKISKENSTIIFANDPSVETEIAVDREDPGKGKVRAHIYAENKAGGQRAVAIDLASGVHLVIAGAERPMVDDGTEQSGDGSMPAGGGHESARSGVGSTAFSGVGEGSFPPLFAATYLSSPPTAVWRATVPPWPSSPAKTVAPIQ
jgi:hypothetical protein